MNEIENLQNRIKELESENEKLKAENIMLRSAGLKQTLEHEQIFKDFIKENAKKKCLALHLLSDFLWLKNRWIRYFVDSATGRHILSEDERKSRLNKARRIERHAWFYLEAYRKAIG